MKQGTIHHAFVPFPKGSSQNPITMEDCIEKFLKCSQLGKKPLTSEQSRRVVHMVLNLENMANLRELIGIIT